MRMAGSYSFEIDEGRDFVLMTLGGFFSPEEIEAFDRARRTAYRKLRCAPNQHVTLIDMRETVIQSQDAVDAFTRSVSDPETCSRKVAFVVSKSLARLQVKRVASSRHAGYFSTFAEAEAWLFQDEAMAA